MTTEISVMYGSEKVNKDMYDDFKLKKNTFGFHDLYLKISAL